MTIFFLKRTLTFAPQDRKNTITPNLKQGNNQIKTGKCEESSQLGARVRMEESIDPVTS
jgi:hypothetical protein